MTVCRETAAATSEHKSRCVCSAFSFCHHFTLQKAKKKQNIPLYSKSCDSVAYFSHSKIRSAASESHAPILQSSSSVSVYVNFCAETRKWTTLQKVTSSQVFPKLSKTGFADRNLSMFLTRKKFTSLSKEDYAASRSFSLSQLKNKDNQCKVSL